jgi:hypothetical protein
MNFGSYRFRHIFSVIHTGRANSQTSTYILTKHFTFFDFVIQWSPSRIDMTQNSLSNKSLLANDNNCICFCMWTYWQNKSIYYLLPLSIKIPFVFIGECDLLIVKHQHIYWLNTSLSLILWYSGLPLLEGHPSYQARFHIYWVSKIVLNSSVP